MEKGESSKNSWQNIKRQKAKTPFGHGPHMIAPRNGSQLHGEQREAGSYEKETRRPDNRFGHLMTEDPGHLNESL